MKTYQEILVGTISALIATYLWRVMQKGGVPSSPPVRCLILVLIIMGALIVVPLSGEDRVHPPEVKAPTDVPVHTSTVPRTLPIPIPPVNNPPATSRRPDPQSEQPPRPPEPQRASGRLLLDLPEDVADDVRVTLNGQHLPPCFRARRALGLKVPVGLHDLVVRNRGRSFTHCVSIREDDDTLVRVTFPPQRLLLEFAEDLEEEVAVHVDDMPTPPAVRGRRVCEVEVALGRRELEVRHGQRIFRTVFVVDTRPCATLSVDFGPPPAARINSQAIGRKEPDSNASLLPVGLARPALEMKTPLDVWRAGLRLQGKRVLIQGDARVFRNLDERLICQFYKGRTCIMTCLIASGREGPLGNEKEDSNYLVTIEAEVKGTKQLGLLILGEGEVFRAE